MNFTPPTWLDLSYFNICRRTNYDLSILYVTVRGSDVIDIRLKGAGQFPAAPPEPAQLRVARALEGFNLQTWLMGDEESIIMMTHGADADY